jgi:hypothetical protein
MTPSMQISCVSVARNECFMIVVYGQKTQEILINDPNMGLSASNRFCA